MKLSLKEQNFVSHILVKIVLYLVLVPQSDDAIIKARESQFLDFSVIS